jgi:thymidylate synthase (FAD)
MYETITIKLLDKMGSDDTVVNAARVSFAKEASQYSPDQNARLINYLATHNHWSPFAHCTLQFHIKAPVFVARQLAKHQVGFAWNEVSRRYVDTDPTFWSPGGAWRAKADNKKQGSADALVGDTRESQDVYEDTMRYCLLSYNLLLANGVCPEQARAVLPQSMMTEWYWTGSLYGFSRVCKLRLDPHAQLECQLVAKGIDAACREAFPISWSVLNGQVD